MNETKTNFERISRFSYAPAILLSIYFIRFHRYRAIAHMKHDRIITTISIGPDFSGKNVFLLFFVHYVH